MASKRLVEVTDPAILAVLNGGGAMEASVGQAGPANAPASAGPVASDAGEWVDEPIGGNPAPAPAAAPSGGGPRLVEVTDPAILEALNAGRQQELEPAMPSGAALPAQTSGITDAERMAYSELGISAPEDRPASPEPRAERPKYSGITSNVAAGANSGLAGVLGLPAGIARAIGAPGAMLGQALSEHVIDPLIGRERTDEQRAESMKRSTRMRGDADDIRLIMDWIGGATTDNTTANTPAERVARAAGEGVAAAAVPYGAAVSAAGRTAAQLGPRAGMVVDMLKAGGARSNIAAGAGGGFGRGYAGESIDPDNPWRGVAELGGEVVGGGLAAGVPAMVRSGGRAISDFVTAPFFSREQLDNLPLGLGKNAMSREEMVAGEIADVAKMPEQQLLNQLREGQEQFAGAMPTTGQIGPTGVAALERSVSRSAEGQGPFIERLAAQEGLAARNVEGMAPGVGADQFGRIVRDQLAGEQAAMAARQASGEQAQTAALAAAGGDRNPSEYGADMLASLVARERAAKQNVGELYRAIDPDGAFGMDIGPLRDQVKKILNELPKMSKLEGREKEIYDDVLRKLDDIETIDEINAARSEMLDFVRNQGAPGGSAPAKRRMTQLRQALDEALDGKWVDEPIPGASAPAAIAEPVSTGRVPGVSARLYDRSGNEYPIQYEVVEASSLKHADGDLQWRNRDSKVSDVQIENYSRITAPERFGPSVEFGTGAPVVLQDGVVLDGNARTAAIRRAYDRGGDPAKRYRDYVIRNYPEAAGMKNPVLIKRLGPDVTPEDAVRLAREGNSSLSLERSAAEIARQDSANLTDDVLSLYRGGDLEGPENSAFVKSFMNKVPESERARFVQSDATLSAEGINRLRLAVARQAYDDDGIISALAVADDDAIRPIGSAMIDAAPALATLRSDIAKGVVSPDMDITKSAVEAARIIQAARKARMPLGDFLQQRDVFSEHDPVAEYLLRVAYGDNLKGRMSRQKFSDFLRLYADSARDQRTDQGGLFGEALPPVSKIDLLRQAAAKQAEGEAPAMPERPRLSAEEREVIPAAQKVLQPLNRDPAVVERMRTASRAHREYMETFYNDTAVDGVLPINGKSPVYDAEIPGKFFNSNPKSREQVMEYARAIGDDIDARNLLFDYAVSDMKRSVVGDNGLVDQRKLYNWLAKNRDGMSALGQLPGGQELVGKLKTVKDATETLALIGRDNASATAAMKRRATMAWSDPETKPIDAMGKLFEGNSGRRIADVAKVIRQDPVAREAFQANLRDYILQEFRGTALRGDALEAIWKPAAFETWMRSNRPLLSRLLDRQAIDGLEDTAKIMGLIQKQTTSTRIPGGSNSPQDLARTRLVEELFQRFAAPVAGIGGALFGGAGNPIGGAITGGAAYLATNAAMNKRMSDLAEERVRMFLDPERARRSIIRRREILDNRAARGSALRGGAAAIGADTLMNNSAFGGGE